MARLAGWLVVLTAVCGVAAAETQITVDAATALVLGDQAEVSGRLFGLTAFEGFTSVVADADYRARVAALRPGCLRFTAGSHWFVPPAYDPAWYETPEAARQFGQALLFGSHYPLGRFLPLVRQMEAEPMASLGGAPQYLGYEGSDRPEDFDKWAAYCVGLIGLWRRFDPGLRLVQVWNEPNADWFRDSRAKEQGGAAALHIAMANKVAAALKQRYPDLQVGGPVLCWPPAWPPGQAGQKPWYTWEQWTLPWLRATRATIDFFDFHVYDVSPEDFAVQTEMLANAALLLQKRRLPIWVTESNYSLRPEEVADPAAVFSRRVLPYERFLLRGVLPQADKLAGNLVHDLHAKNFTVLPRGADDPDPMYWLLWVLRDLRGRRVVADCSDPELLTYATLEQDRVTLVAFNDSNAEKPVTLQANLPGGWWTGPEIRALVPDAKQGCTRPQLPAECTRDGARATVSLAVPAYGTASISFRLPLFPVPSRQRTRRESFADQTLVALGEQAVRVRLPAQAAPAERGWLRLGLLGIGKQDAVGVRLNGTELSAAATALQDLPLQAGALHGDDELQVWLKRPAAQPTAALAFAALVTEMTTAP